MPAPQFGQKPGLYSQGRFEAGGGEPLISSSPVDGSVLGELSQVAPDQFEQIIQDSKQAFLKWRQLPAPQRGEVIRLIGEALRENKQELGELISWEMGKILSEGLGEVQEAIDMADLAVGMSRQLYGVTTHSERPRHRMYEQWHPLGPIAVITAFNFPIAVWAWNAMVALACGDTVIWKPSSKTPFCALRTMEVIAPVLKDAGYPDILSLAIGPSSTWGETLIKDRRIPLVSATGSCKMGRRIGEVVSGRLGRSLLELGGNNALLISEKAKLDLALQATVFGAVGTAGQRCTSTRRLLVQRSIYDQVIEKLCSIYKTIKVGSPLENSTLVGPLIDQEAVATMQSAIVEAKSQGGEVMIGGEAVSDLDGGCYAKPCLIKVNQCLDIMRDETFAPILYVQAWDTLEEAIAEQNQVDQGLSSALFTEDVQESETFLSAIGSDCGIANINCGTSGAEIGLAFGGEKDTGGGREAGSDSWKVYMRRQTNTINWSGEAHLAQGVSFDV